jgi:hypothetical protein
MGLLLLVSTMTMAGEPPLPGWKNGSKTTGKTLSIKIDGFVNGTGNPVQPNL